jgi:hypothetical protein
MIADVLTKVLVKPKHLKYLELLGVKENQL